MLRFSQIDLYSIQYKFCATLYCCYIRCVMQHLSHCYFIISISNHGRETGKTRLKKTLIAVSFRVLLSRVSIVSITQRNLSALGAAGWRITTFFGWNLVKAPVKFI